VHTVANNYVPCGIQTEPPAKEHAILFADRDNGVGVPVQPPDAPEPLFGHGQARGDVVLGKNQRDGCLNNQLTDEDGAPRRTALHVDDLGAYSLKSFRHSVTDYFFAMIPVVKSPPVDRNALLPKRARHLIHPLAVIH
jgi:hypothetical protein